MLKKCYKEKFSSTLIVYALSMTTRAETLRGLQAHLPVSHFLSLHTVNSVNSFLQVASKVTFLNHEYLDPTQLIVHFNEIINLHYKSL